eukprot:6108802-Lingulodinium_polyedra.AAC.1
MDSPHRSSLGPAGRFPRFLNRRARVAATPRQDRRGRGREGGDDGAPWAVGVAPVGREGREEPPRRPASS